MVFFVCKQLHDIICIVSKFEVVNLIKIFLIFWKEKLFFELNDRGVKDLLKNKIISDM